MTNPSGHTNEKTAMPLQNRDLGNGPLEVKPGSSSHELSLGAQSLSRAYTTLMGSLLGPTGPTCSHLPPGGLLCP